MRSFKFCFLSLSAVHCTSRIYQLLNINGICLKSSVPDLMRNIYQLETTTTLPYLGAQSRAGKKCRLVDNIGARLGSEANFGSHKIKISG